MQRNRRRSIQIAPSCESSVSCANMRKKRSYGTSFIFLSIMGTTILSHYSQNTLVNGLSFVPTHPAQLSQAIFTTSNTRKIPYSTGIRSRGTTRGTSSVATFMIEKAVYEVDPLSGAPTRTTYSTNSEAEANASTMEHKIVNLLSDDHGEEDDHVTDDSVEAAMEIADKKVYSRISEEAKYKANAVMQKKKEDVAAKSIKKEAVVTKGSRRRQQNGISNKSLGTRTKVRASVKETGGDSMSEYVKSMGQHELLPQQSEILLGKQIQLLVKWEGVRQELEEKHSR